MRIVRIRKDKGLVGQQVERHLSSSKLGVKLTPHFVVV